MKTKIFIFNWKMNPSTLLEAKKLAKISDKKNVIICPPFLFLNEIKKNIKKAEIGAQDVFWMEEGAFTGETSVLMLRKIGCKYIIVGHSERRSLLKENNEDINKKVRKIISLKLNPILCIGSDKKNRDSEKEIELQLKKALTGIKTQEIKNVIIAYEPIWAISSNKNSSPATPEDAEKAEIFVRKILVELFDGKEAKKVKFLYGGSVDGENVESFIKLDNIDGVLIGSASLKEKEIKKILKK